MLNLDHWVSTGKEDMPNTFWYQDRYLIEMGTGDDHNLSTDSIATPSCSVLTAYGAVKNANLGPNDNVLIVRAGGLGLMAILARTVGCPSG